MFQIDPLSGLSCIKHLTCEATFQMNGEKILGTHPITCPNCKIRIDEEALKDSVEKLNQSIVALNRINKLGNGPYGRLPRPLL